MATAAILNFKNFNFWSRDCCHRVQYLIVVYQVSSKSDDFSLRYGDLTIFKMAAVRHLGFKNLQFLLCRPCRRAVLFPHTKFL